MAPGSAERDRPNAPTSGSPAAPRENRADTTSISPLKGRGAAPAPALSTRRSSDSTVGLSDSPQMLSEGLRTDDEDYSGHRSDDGGDGGGGGGRVAWTGGGVGSAEAIDMAPPAMTGRGSANRTPADVLTGGGDADHLSRCESVGGDTTRAGSFCLPGSSALGGGSQVALVGGGTDGRGQSGGGGDVDGSEMESEAGLTVVTATETPAGTSVAPAPAPGRGGRGSSGEVAGRAAVLPEGCQGLEQAHGGGMTVRGSMLDAYREPEGNNWEDELEDWRGLPGLQLATGSGVGAAMQSRLQVTSSEANEQYAWWDSRLRRWALQG